MKEFLAPHYREMKMQQTKSYWRLLAVTGVVSAFIASACVVTTDDDDSSSAGASGSGTAGASAGSSAAGSPAAGSGTAGSSTAGGSAGGSTGGSGAIPFECDPDVEGGAPPGMPNECPQNSTDECEICIHDHCCDLFAECYATSPGNQCGYGGPNNEGEAYCIQLCLQDITQMTGAAPDDSDVQSCAANCATTLSNQATKECGSVIGYQTSALVDCQLMNCSAKCYGPNEK